ncbi:MAG: hypothetical protein U9R01_04885 [candidate division WOR-3 bacterium]|nr:hypothetical protein [candidate division WOR-3 bacterium]
MSGKPLKLIAIFLCLSSLSSVLSGFPRVAFGGHYGNVFFKNGLANKGDIFLKHSLNNKWSWCITLFDFHSYQTSRRNSDYYEGNILEPEELTLSVEEVSLYVAPIYTFWGRQNIELCVGINGGVLVMQERGALGVCYNTADLYPTDIFLHTAPFLGANIRVPNTTLTLSLCYKFHHSFGYYNLNNNYLSLVGGVSFDIF